MRPLLPLLASILFTTAAVAHGAKPVKKKPVPKPTPAPAPAPSPPPEEKTPEPEKPKSKPSTKLELGACTAEPLDEIDAAALVTLVRKRCRNLRVPEGSAPTELGEDEMLVAICVQDGDEGEPEAVEPKSCGMKALVHVESTGQTIGAASAGDFALTVTTKRIAKQTALTNGTLLALVASTSDGKSVRSPLVWKKAVDGYGGGRYLWFPLPMLTTDFSSSSNGYRLGLSPLAVAVGAKYHPSALSRAYFGASVFAAWNLLVPNDTQTLSNSTYVRINYKALGAGVLLDAAGFVSLGVGFGRTFTTDARTDLRFWIYFGPRLLGGLNEF